MKVSEYIKQGLKNRVDNPPEDYQLLGSHKEGAHKVECFVKVDNGKIVDAKYTSSKRCKKLMAIADYVCELIKGQSINNLYIDDEKILSFFKEERDREKMKNRLDIVKKALGI